MEEDYEKILEKTRSVCEEDVEKQVNAYLVEKEDGIYLQKDCDEHGKKESIFFRDPDIYEKWKNFEDTRKESIEENVAGLDERYMGEHDSQPVLTNLYVTNRCNLRCSYCFTNAGAEGFVYEPSMEEIDKMLEQGRNTGEVGSKALQITGGEPTVRDDLFEIAEKADEKGYTHIQLNTNGIKIARDKEYAEKVKESPFNTIYMSFDGINKKVNPWIEQNKEAIENLAEVDFGSVVLVPVAMKENKEEWGDIVRYAQDNLDVVRGVNFQPISFTGRNVNMDREKIEDQRVEYTELFETLEDQLGGEIAKKDWYPVSFVYPISKMVENLKDEKQVEFTAHPGCGGATYAFREEEELVPITDFVDVEGLRDKIQNAANLKGPLKKTRAAFEMWKNLNSLVDEEKAPEGMDVKKILKDALVKGDYDAIGKFHEQSLFLGAMWFQDPYNFNVDRTSRCVIQYTTPEGMSSFCVYNGLGKGREIREKHGTPLEEWEEKEEKSLEEDLVDGDIPVS